MVAIVHSLPFNLHHHQLGPQFNSDIYLNGLDLYTCCPLLAFMLAEKYQSLRAVYSSAPISLFISIFSCSKSLSLLSALTLSLSYGELIF